VKTQNWTTLVAGALLLSSLSAIPGYAAEHVTVKTGYLTCHEAGGWGFIIGSSHKIHCTYTSNNHRTEYYTGTISKFGATSATCNPLLFYGRSPLRPRI
jgi:hypothetical protein